MEESRKDVLINSLKSNKVFVWILWLSFPLYGFIASQFLLPPDTSQTNEIIVAAFTGDVSSVEPLVFAVFNMLGVIPLLYAFIVLFDGKEQRFPAWPFVLVSFFSGALGIFPYIALRQWRSKPIGRKTGLQRFMDYRVNGIILGLLGLGLVGFGLIAGDFANYIKAYETINLVHVMTFDFFILVVVLGFLVFDDAKRRGMNSSVATLLSLLPLIGPMLYMMVRPKLEYVENA